MLPWPSSPTDPPLSLLLNSLHSKHRLPRTPIRVVLPWRPVASAPPTADGGIASTSRSEEHTSELQSRFDLVCRLLLEKKNKAFVGNYRKKTRRLRTSQEV